MRKLRPNIPHGLFEITVRTFQDRPLLQPVPSIGDVIVGVLGRAQRRYGMKMHALVFLSTHYHLLVTARDSLQLALFMGFVNSNVAREVGRSIGWHDKFWSRRYEAIPVSDEESAQVSRLSYLLAHGVKEGLVARPEEWPGVHSWAALLAEGELVGTWYDRSREYEARRSRKPQASLQFAEVERVHLTALPCWRGLSESVRRDRLRDLHAAVVAQGEALRRMTGRAPLGPKAVMKRDPSSLPTAVKRSSAPRIHAVNQAVRRAFFDSYRQFTVAYRAAAEALRRGDRLAKFPPGCFPPHLPWVPASSS